MNNNIARIFSNNIFFVGLVSNFHGRQMIGPPCELGKAGDLKPSGRKCPRFFFLPLFFRFVFDKITTKP